MSGFTLPVIMDYQWDGYFVAIDLHHPMYALPSGSKHSRYAVWAEVTDTEAGSATVYHRAYQLFHGRLDKAVRNAQKPAP